MWNQVRNHFSKHMPLDAVDKIMNYVKRRICDETGLRRISSRYELGWKFTASCYFPGFHFEWIAANFFQFQTVSLPLQFGKKVEHVDWCRTSGRLVASWNTHERRWRLLAMQAYRSPPGVQISLKWDGSEIATTALRPEEPYFACPATLSHDDHVSTIEFSWDGKMVAVLAGFTARIWEVDTGKLLHSLRIGLCLVSWSPDGGTLYIAKCNHLLMFDLETGQVQKCWTVPNTQSAIAAVQCSPTDADAIAVGALHDKTLYVVSRQGVVRHAFPVTGIPGSHGAARNLQWDPRGMRIAVISCLNFVDFLSLDGSHQLHQRAFCVHAFNWLPEVDAFACSVQSLVATYKWVVKPDLPSCHPRFLRMRKAWRAADSEEDCIVTQISPCGDSCLYSILRGDVGYWRVHCQVASCKPCPVDTGKHMFVARESPVHIWSPRGDCIAWTLRDNPRLVTLTDQWGYVKGVAIARGLRDVALQARGSSVYLGSTCEHRRPRISLWNPVSGMSAMQIGLGRDKAPAKIIQMHASPDRGRLLVVCRCSIELYCYVYEVDTQTHKVKELCLPRIGGERTMDIASVIFSPDSKVTLIHNARAIWWYGTRPRPLFVRDRQKYDICNVIFHTNQYVVVYTAGDTTSRARYYLLHIAGLTPGLPSSRS